jgi:hypothetical protein
MLPSNYKGFAHISQLPCAGFVSVLCMLDKKISMCYALSQRCIKHLSMFFYTFTELSKTGIGGQKLLFIWDKINCHCYTIVVGVTLIPMCHT